MENFDEATNLPYPVIRLEYCEEDHTFHFEDPNANNKNTWGYQTIYPHIQSNLADEFADIVEKKYNNTATTSQVIQELKLFFESRGI